MEPYEDLNNRLASYETCLSEAEIEEAEAEREIARVFCPHTPDLCRFNLERCTYECSCTAVLYTFDVDLSPRAERQRGC